MLALLIIIIALHTFCNGYMVAVTDQKRYEDDTNVLSFGAAWDKEVSESQDTKVGTFLMRLFYIIPTMVGIVSKEKETSTCYED